MSQAKPRRHRTHRTWSLPRLRLPYWRGLLGIGLLGATVWAGFQIHAWLIDPRNLPFRVVSIEGDHRYLSNNELQAVVLPLLGGGFFGLDVREVRGEVEKMPWIRQAAVRRVWPDRLVVRVAEHEPFARYNADALITPQGRLFRPPIESFPPGLPQLEGSEREAWRVLRRFKDLSQKFQRLGLRIAALKRDARGGWDLRLADGPVIRLGRERQWERLDRFLAVYPRLGDPTQMASVDARYTNGFAVRWKTATEPARSETKGRSNT